MRVTVTRPIDTSEGLIAVDHRVAEGLAAAIEAEGSVEADVESWQFVGSTRTA
jgi:hypothetical protein